MAITSPTALLSGGITDSLKDIAPKSSATSGDASTGPVTAGQIFSFSNATPFNVGAGSASARADAGAGADARAGNTLVYLALGLAVVGVLVAVLRRK